MALEKRQTEVNGRAYVLLTPPVRQAMPLCTKMAVLLGPVLATLGSEIANGGLSKLGEALQGVDPARLDALFMEALRISKTGFGSITLSEDVDFERHFGQYPDDLYMVCSWAVWECCRDFLPAALGSLQIKEKMREAFMKKMEEGFQSPQDGQ